MVIASGSCVEWGVRGVFDLRIPGEEGYDGVVWSTCGLSFCCPLVLRENGGDALGE